VWDIYWLSEVSVPICRSTISIVHGVRVGLMAIYEWGGGGFLVQQIASYESSSSYKARIFTRYNLKAMVSCCRTVKVSPHWSLPGLHKVLAAWYGFLLENS
jgi:hypothetical protein